MDLAESKSMDLRVLFKPIFLFSLYFFCTLIYKNAAHANAKCHTLFGSESISQAQHSPDRFVFDINNTEVILDFSFERDRFYKKSSPFLAFGLSPLLPPEKSWPVKDRLFVRRFFEIASDHESRARFYFHFLVLVTGELSRSGTAKEKSAYLRTQKIPLRIIENQLFAMAEQFGFQITTLTDVVRDREFKNLIKSGNLILDEYFAGEEHGAHTHIFQILQIAYTLDHELGLGTTLSIYQTIGNERNFKNWKLNFDDTNGSPHSPENLNRTIRSFLRF